MFYKVLKLFRLLMALLMGVVMDLLDFGLNLCAKLYFLRHKMIERNGNKPELGLSQPKLRILAPFLWQQMGHC